MLRSDRAARDADRPLVRRTRHGQLDWLVTMVACTVTGGHAALADAPATFPGPLHQLGTTVLDIESGDWNGDGNGDFVVLVADRIEVLLGDGRGDYALQSRVHLDCTDLRSIAVGDIDGDGHLDAAVTCSPTGGVTILLGDGTGALTPAGSTSAILGQWGLVLVDIDLDDDLDIVVAKENGIAFALNNGSGVYGAVTTVPRPGVFREIAVGHLNDDAFVDAVLVTSAGLKIQSFLGTGAGFEAGITTPLPGSGTSTSISLADLDGDGILDVATENNGIRLMVGDGVGGFGPVLPIDELNGSPYAVAAADANGDGHVDILAAHVGNEALAFYAGDGTGDFESPRSTFVRTDPRAFDLADMDSDGVLDAIIGIHVDVALLEGDGKGLFRRHVRTTADNPPDLGFVRVIDLDGDGVHEILARAQNAAYRAEGDGEGGFGNLVYWPGGDLLGGNPQFEVDLDGDGTVELVSMLSNDVRVVRYASDDTLVFVQQVHQEDDGFSSGMTIADVNGDGLPDVVLARNDAPRTILATGDAANPLGTVVPIDVDIFVDDVAAGDFNGDGLIDLAFLGLYDGVVLVLPGLGQGEFGTPVPVVTDPDASYLRGIDAGDVSGDGLDDVVLGSRDADSSSFGKTWLLRGNPKELVESPEIIMYGGTPRLVRLVDLDDDQRCDIVTSTLGAGITGITVLLARDDGFSDPRTHIGIANDQTIDFADVDGSGTPDIVVAELSEGVTIGLNRYGPCPLDFDGDGLVSYADLVTVLAAWGQCPASCPWDSDGDGFVDADDLLAVLTAWGPCPLRSG